MVARRYATFTSNNMADAERKLDEWSQRGLSAAIYRGMEQFGSDLQWAAHGNMKLPSQGKKGPLDVGLRWRRTLQFASKPEPGPGPAEWTIRTQPQYLAMWQEVGTRPHTVFDPDKQRSKAFMRNVRRQNRAEARKTKWENTDFSSLSKDARDKATRSLTRAEKTIEKTKANLRDLKSATGTNAVMGYSDPSRIPKRNQRSDWFKGNTPTATTGRRAGQGRPVQVRAGQKIQVNKGTQASKPIWRGAIKISGMHRDRMARRIADAYEKRGR